MEDCGTSRGLAARAKVSGDASDVILCVLELDGDIGNAVNHSWRLLFLFCI